MWAGRPSCSKGMRLSLVLEVEMENGLHSMCGCQPPWLAYYRALRRSPHSSPFSSLARHVPSCVFMAPAIWCSLERSCGQLHHNETIDTGHHYTLYVPSSYGQSCANLIILGHRYGFPRKSTTSMMLALSQIGMEAFTHHRGEPAISPGASYRMLGPSAHLQEEKVLQLLGKRRRHR